MSPSGARCALLVTVMLPAAAAQSLFLGTDHQLSIAAHDVITLDLDGDHDLDLAIAGMGVEFGSVGVVQFWFNDGSDGLVPGPKFDTAKGSARLGRGDLDADGDADLVVLASPNWPQTVGSVTALRSDGLGGVTAIIATPLAGTPIGDPQLADMDADGLPDLAARLKDTADVAILRNTGAGSFASPSKVTAGPEPTVIALSDLQVDGDPDLVVLNGLAGILACAPGAAGTTFGSTTSWPLGASASALLVATLDGDEFADALVADATGATLRLLRGDGAGGWLAPELLPGVADIEVLKASDIDLDGDLDVVATNTSLGSGSQAAAVFRAAGDGTFAAPVGALTGFDPKGVDMGDVNGDHLPDLVAVLDFTVLAERYGDGLGGFPDNFEVGTGWSAKGDLGDVDGDGLLDLVLCDFGFLDAMVLKGDGHGHLSAPTSVGDDSTHFPFSAALADITGDGFEDILLSDGAITLFASDGAGGFLPSTKTGGVEAEYDILTMDLDGDADPDVVTNNKNHDGVAVTRNVNGLLPTFVLTKTPQPEVLALGHIDGDGNPDAVVAHDPGIPFTVLRGDGDAGWLPATFVPGEGSDVLAIGLGDIDSDGFDDLVTASNVGAPNGRLAVRLADGLGGLGSPIVTTVSPDARALDLGDLDLDGILDVAIASLSQVLVVRGVGDGSFAMAEGHLGGVGHTMVRLADMDLDGARDIVAYSQGISAAWVLRNQVGESASWSHLGFALDGNSAPRLAGAGSLVPGTPGHVTLVDALPSVPAALFIAGTSAPAAFKGGTLVPVPPALVILFVVPPDGQLQMAWSAWPDVPSGTSFYLQMALVDAGAPAHVALTDALEGTVP